MYEYSSQNNEVLIRNKQTLKTKEIVEKIFPEGWLLFSLLDDWANGIGMVADSNTAFSVKNNLLKRAM